jgi:WD40 repeat protein/serine/threonine protein kinase
MSQPEADRIRRIFDEILDTNRDDRERELARLCGDDATLRARVEALLAAHERNGDLLESPTNAAANAAAAAVLDRFAETSPESDGAVAIRKHTAEPASQSHVGTTIGPYKLLQLIGEGGFGTVYMAEQQTPIRRRVALKLIKLGMDTKQVVARFEAERQALAMMEHPNIARVLDAGATESGRPFFVMELVRGVPITEYCDEKCLSARERLELFTDVCAAVQHAHQKGVVHRDIKPSNVLVTQSDGRAVSKVIDFGVARATGYQLTERTLFTEFDQFIGTPLYMSPEQAETGGHGVDTRSDIYSLGVLLYELLTGTTPFTSGQIRNVAYAEVLRLVQQVDPPPPSTRLSQLGETGRATARLRASEPNALQKLLRGDLDWIVMKALEKDRARRYASASELAADIGRYFVGDPVSAGPPDIGYRLRKIVRRNRGKAAAAAAVVMAIVLGASLAGWQALEAQRQAQRARASAVVTSAMAAQDPLLKALLIDEIAGVADLPGRLAVLRDVANDPLPAAVIRPGERPGQWDYSPDGELVAASVRDGTARVWRTNGSGPPLVLRHPAAVHGVAFSPDSRRIATGSADGTVRIWELDGGGVPLELAGHDEGGMWTLRFSPDGRQIAVRSAGVISVWSTGGDGIPSVLSVDGVELNRPAWSRDGERILAGGSDETLRIWRTEGAEAPVELEGHGSGGVGTAGIEGLFTPDGERVVVWGGDGAIRVARADGSGTASVLEPADPAIESVSIAADGRFIVLGYLDGTVRLLPMDGVDEPIAFRHSAAVEDAVLTPDGTRLLAGSWDGSVRAFPVRPSVPVPHIDGIQPQSAVSFRGPPGLAEWAVSDDGSRIAVGFAADGSIRTWRLDDTGEATVVFRGNVEVWDARFSPDGQRLATVFGDGSVRILSVTGSEPTVVLGAHDHGARRVAFSPDGRRIVASSADSTARIWSVEGVAEPVVLPHPDVVYSAVFGPDGRNVATASRDGRIRVWNLSDPSSPEVVHEHDAEALSVSFSPDGMSVASGSWDGTASIREGSTGEPLVLRGNAGGVWEVAFSPDGRLLATAGDQGEVRILDAAGGGQVAELRGHQGIVANVVFSPDGTRVATASHDGTARVWRIDGADEPLVLRGHRSRVSTVDFSPDGSRVVTASFDGTVRIWRVTWPELLDYVRSNVHACLTAEQRIQYLAEPHAQARSKAAACEHRLRERG